MVQTESLILIFRELSIRKVQDQNSYINYEANTCSDNLVINALPSSQLFDTLICSTSNDLILNVLPSGGY